MYISNIENTFYINEPLSNKGIIQTIVYLKVEISSVL